MNSPTNDNTSVMSTPVQNAEEENCFETSPKPPNLDKTDKIVNVQDKEHEEKFFVVEECASDMDQSPHSSDLSRKRGQKDSDSVEIPDKRSRDVDATPPPAKWHTVRLIIPCQSFDRVIGEDGDVIEELKSQHKVKISYIAHKRLGYEGVITCKAQSKVALAECVGAIAKLMQHYLHHKEQASMRILLHKSMPSYIIGTGGAKIKQIREKTKVRIKISNQLAPNSSDRVCQINGEVDGIEKCIVEFLTIAENFQSRVPPRKSNYEPCFDDSYNYGGYNKFDSLCIHHLKTGFTSRRVNNRQRYRESRSPVPSQHGGSTDHYQRGRRDLPSTLGSNPPASVYSNYNSYDQRQRYNNNSDNRRGATISGPGGVDGRRSGRPSHDFERASPALDSGERRGNYNAHGGGGHHYGYRSTSPQPEVNLVSTTIEESRRRTYSRSYRDTDRQRSNLSNSQQHHRYRDLLNDEISVDQESSRYAVENSSASGDVQSEDAHVNQVMDQPYERLTIASGAVGCVIGKGGENIRRLIRESGAIIEIFNLDLDGKRVVSIQGNASQTLKAKLLLRQCLEKFLQ